MRALIFGFAAVIAAGSASAQPKPAAKPDPKASGGVKLVAVLDFTDKGPSVDLGVLSKAIPEMLLGDLSQYSDIGIVERGRVDQLLGEKNLGRGGLVDSKTAQAAGRELAADYLMTGTYSATGKRLTVTATMLDVAASKTIGTWTLTGQADKLFELEKDLAAKAAVALGLKENRRRPAPAAKPGPSPITAVLGFRNLSPSARLTPMEGGFAELLQVGLGAVRDVRLVEREKLNEVLREQKLSLSGLTGAGNSVAIGKLLGAERMVFGSFVEIGDSLRLEVRVADVATAAIVRTETALGPTEKFADLLDDLALRIAAALSVQPQTDAMRDVRNSAPTRKLEAAIHIGEADVAAREGRFADSAASYGRALLADADNRWLDFMRVRALDHAGDLAAECEAGEQALGRVFRPDQLSLKEHIYGWLVHAYGARRLWEEKARTARRAMAEFASIDDRLEFSRAASSALVELNRRGEAEAILREAYEAEKKKGKSLRFARALTALQELHSHDVAGRTSLTFPDRTEAEKARQLFREILDAAAGDPRPEWNNWAKRPGIQSVLSRRWKAEDGNLHPLFGVQEQVEALTQLTRVFADQPAVVYAAKRGLCYAYMNLGRWREAADAMRDFADGWKGQFGEPIPHEWDLQQMRFGPMTIADARYTYGEILNLRLGDDRNGLAAYKEFVRTSGLASLHGPLAARNIRALGGEIEYPAKCALIVGGGQNSWESWRRVLTPMGFTVHSHSLYRITASQMAPYSLVVYVRQGAIALEPSEVLAFRSYVACGGSLLAIASPGWIESQPLILNPVLSFFGINAGTGGPTWSKGSAGVPHPINKGIGEVRAKHAVVLECPPDASVVKSGEKTILAAVPYRRGRVVAASFSQWFLPQTDWLGPDWPTLLSYQSSVRSLGKYEEMPVESGDNLQLPLLRNVVNWLTEAGPGRPEGSLLPKAFRAAHMEALQYQTDSTARRERLSAALEKLVGSSGTGELAEEALWVAGEALGEIRLTWAKNNESATELPFDYRSAPEYYRRIVAEHPRSPMRPFAQWRLGECVRYDRCTAFLRNGGNPQNEYVPANEAIPLFQKVEAPRASLAWAWANLRLGQLHVHGGDFQAGLARFRDVADNMAPGPEKSMAVQNAAMCAQALGDSEGAKRWNRLVLTVPDVYWWTWMIHHWWAPMGPNGKSMYQRSTSHRLANYLLKQSNDGRN